MTTKTTAATEEMTRDELITGTVYRLVSRHGLDGDLAAAMCRGLCQFLVLLDESPAPLSPPTLIDHAWHEALVDTRRYGAFCRRYFSRYLHHDPPTSPAPPVSAAGGLSVAQTVDLALARFADAADRKVWRRGAGVRALRSSHV